MESQSLLLNQKLEAIDILKEAVKVYAKNINFIIIAILTSIPFFCFSVYNETFLQKILLETSEIFKQTTRYVMFDRPTTFDITTRLDKNFLYHIIQMVSLLSGSP
ncbi:hypothetical protein PanWU01x14_160640 [Parasponia andersonii]|uniref:Uncharacterized protein n=1 Tax=Parasponia andersonii TaxID=3476 RepID=A0A2P5CE86_PARAD|nr:hypothetical protein PanWU01x14_160640 [Parasponia andersonii]